MTSPTSHKYPKRYLESIPPFLTNPIQHHQSRLKPVSCLEPWASSQFLSADWASKCRFCFKSLMSCWRVPSSAIKCCLDPCRKTSDFCFLCFFSINPEVPWLPRRPVHPNHPGGLLWAERNEKVTCGFSLFSPTGLLLGSNYSFNVWCSISFWCKVVSVNDGFYLCQDVWFRLS